MIFAMIAFTAVVGAYLTVQTGWLFLVLGDLLLHRDLLRMDRFRYPACPWGNFQWLHDGLRHLRLNRLLERRHQSAFYLTVDFASGAFRLDGNLWAVLAIVVASLPLVCSIANIMLANNLRDLDTDIENHRYTLVYYIGRPAGLCCFKC